MNELSNHDHSRFMTRTNGMAGRIATAGAEAANENVKKAIFKQGVVMQMTLPGAPTLYYGDEPACVDGQIRTTEEHILGEKKILN